MELTFENTKKVYMEWFKAKGRSKSVLRARAKTLDLFFMLMDSRGLELISEITESDLKAFMVWRSEAINRFGRQNQHGHRNSEITAVNDIFVVLNKMELYVPSKPLSLPQVKAPSLKLPKVFLTTRDIVKVLKLVDISTFEGLMMRTILEVFIATGIRKKEVETLVVGDVYLKEQRLVVRDTKTKIDRVVPINLTCTEMLTQYLKALGKQKKLESNTVVFQKNLKPLPDWYLTLEFKKLGEKAKLKHGLHTRMFRHWVATRLVKKGMNIRCVQELLGHTSLDTTMVYVHLENVKVERELRRLHPRRDR